MKSMTIDDLKKMSIQEFLMQDAFFESFRRSLQNNE